MADVAKSSQGVSNNENVSGLTLCEPVSLEADSLEVTSSAINNICSDDSTKDLLNNFDLPVSDDTSLQELIESELALRISGGGVPDGDDEVERNNVVESGGCVDVPINNHDPEEEYSKDPFVASSPLHSTAQTNSSHVLSSEQVESYSSDRIFQEYCENELDSMDTVKAYSVSDSEQYQFENSTSELPESFSAVIISSNNPSDYVNEDDDPNVLSSPSPDFEPESDLLDQSLEPPCSTTELVDYENQENVVGEDGLDGEVITESLVQYDSGADQSDSGCVDVANVEADFDPIPNNCMETNIAPSSVELVCDVPTNNQDVPEEKEEEEEEKEEESADDVCAISVNNNQLVEQQPIEEEPEPEEEKCEEIPQSPEVEDQAPDTINNQRMNSYSPVHDVSVCSNSSSSDSDETSDDVSVSNFFFCFYLINLIMLCVLTKNNKQILDTSFKKPLQYFMQSYQLRYVISLNCISVNYNSFYVNFLVCMNLNWEMHRGRWGCEETNRGP